MADYSQDAMRRRLSSQYGGQDPRSYAGQFSRGSNVYNGGSHSAGGGRPRTMQGGMQNKPQPPSNQSATFGGGTPSQGQDQNQPYTFGFNPAYAARMRQLQQQRAGLNSQMELGERRLGENYAFNMDALQRALDRNLEGNEQNMADQGILRSGINVRQQGRIGEDHQRGVSELAMQVARQREDMQRAYASSEQDIFNQIEQLEFQRAQEEAQQRREEEMRNAEMEAMQKALENMQPVMDSAGRYHLAGWRQMPNTSYNLGVAHDYGSAIERALQQ